MYISILIIKKYRYKCSAVLYVYLYINYQELSSFMLLVATPINKKVFGPNIFLNK